MGIGWDGLLSHEFDALDDSSVWDGYRCVAGEFRNDSTKVDRCVIVRVI